MAVIVLEPELYRRVEVAAQTHAATVDDILAEAVRRHLWQLDRRKISEESQLFHQQHTELKARYLGQYIAMHEGEVVDHDADFQALRQRVRQRFGPTPVMMMLVEETAEPVLTRRGFLVEVPPP